MPRCADCGHDNPPTARFCGRCSGALTDALGPPAHCPRCGKQLIARAAACHHCGALVAAARTGGVTKGRRELPFGAVLAGRYTVERQVGRGGMGSVYAVQDGRLGGKRWALKEMISDDLSPSQLETAVRAFGQEAGLLANLSHPNLPQVIDFFSEGARHFLVMEYIEGRTLDAAARADGGKLPEVLVTGWAIQICAALSYLHGRRPPIIFRDLKPANVMLTPEDRIKLIDFGIARLFKQGQGHDTASLGTHGYAAPECYGQGQSDARTDVYSLGATLHFLLTGDNPSAHPFVFAAPRSLNPSLSALMETFISRAVQLDPAQRFQTMDAARTALISIGLGGRSEPASSPAARSSSGPTGDMPATRSDAPPTARPNPTPTGDAPPTLRPSGPAVGMMEQSAEAVRPVPPDQLLAEVDEVPGDAEPRSTQEVSPRRQPVGDTECEEWGDQPHDAPASAEPPRMEVKTVPTVTAVTPEPKAVGDTSPSWPRPEADAAVGADTSTAPPGRPAHQSLPERGEVSSEAPPPTVDETAEPPRAPDTSADPGRGISSVSLPSAPHTDVAAQAGPEVTTYAMAFGKAGEVGPTGGGPLVAGRCPKCAVTLPRGAVFCGSCGQQLSGALTGNPPARPTEALCPRCRRPAPAGTRFCGVCGAAFVAPLGVADRAAPRPASLPRGGAVVHPEDRPCPRCGRSNPIKSWHCAGCGAALPL